MTQSIQSGSYHAVHWRQVSIFLALTFMLTWGVNLVLYLSGGLAHPAAALALQSQMLIPAFAAIFLMLFIFKDSPVHVRRDYESEYPRRPRLFFIFFLAYTIIYVVLGILGLIMPAQVPVYGAAGLALSGIGLMFLILLRVIGGSETFARLGLGGGRPRDWLLYGLAFVIYYTIQTGLNAVFDLGQPVDVEGMLGGLGVDLPLGGFLALAAFQAIVIGPFLGLLLAFGEEYGWRGFLQGELIKMGKVRGILLLGVIWGVWHYPVILMGHNYPGRPLLGVVLMTGYTIGLAFVLGYIMLRTGSVWLVAFLHAVNNQTAAFLFGLVYQPDDTAFSFGIGIPGLFLLALIVLLALRDPLWRDPSKNGLQWTG